MFFFVILHLLVLVCRIGRRRGRRRRQSLLILGAGQVEEPVAESGRIGGAAADVVARRHQQPAKGRENDVLRRARLPHSTVDGTVEQSDQTNSFQLKTKFK